ncbi:MAG: SDR family NAD(P)-dependent oxidoreductase [Acidipropionibacterium sp.]|jgi:NAD(P)-dependent dehydrogenase (short-subunit alcohol dehydrogenase family)|nr:SDR family NAD(P)-dependent oxidoreductase [Acidipropionibacterium sp.]
MARILVTGASTGLGLLTAQSLVRQGHDVVLHARAAERVEDAPLLRRVLGTVYGDLADLDAVRRIAEEAHRFAPFDAVIHNAGVSDGPDLVAVNVIAPYALTGLMERPSRMIVLSSSMHRGGATNHVAEGIAGRRTVTYSDTKLWATAVLMGIAGRWSGTLAHAVDPGWVPTRMGGPSASDDLTEGHRTQEWLAVTPVDGIHPRTGGYWHHRQPRRPHPAALDARFQDEVIAALEERTGIEL